MASEECLGELVKNPSMNAKLAFRRVHTGLNQRIHKEAHAVISSTCCVGHGAFESVSLSSLSMDWIGALTSQTDKSVAPEKCDSQKARMHEK